MDFQRCNLNFSGAKPADHGISDRNPRDCHGANRARREGEWCHRRRADYSRTSRDGAGNRCTGEFSRRRLAVDGDLSDH
jgi:hypothetical protein